MELRAERADVVRALAGVGVLIAAAAGAITYAEGTHADHQVQAAAGPLVVHPDNGRYFAEPSGRPVLLAGSHTWSNLQDSGGAYPPPAFDYDGYLDFLERYNHNFFRLWVWEQSRWSTETDDDNYWYYPLPWRRTGMAPALDGLPQHDLNDIDPAWLLRVRRRVMDAGRRGIYVSVMLFNGWSVSQSKGGHAEGNPWRGHPFHRANNKNGLDGDPQGLESGEAVHSLELPSVVAVEERYVRALVGQLTDLDNVLYEISNESHAGSEAWQEHMIQVVRGAEAPGRRHPVGMTVEWPGGDNADLLASSADWISPNGPLHDPPPADGGKVILHDTDHLCGICGDRSWVWMSVTRGMNPVFMDGYDGAAYGSGGAGFQFDDPQWVSLRENLGYAREAATRLGPALAGMEPAGARVSTGYGLAGGDAYLVYAPEGGPIAVDMDATESELEVAWLRPSDGTWVDADPVEGGGERFFEGPFPGEAVLLIRPDSTHGLWLPFAATTG